MQNMKEELGGIGKKMDDSISEIAKNIKEKTKETTKKVAKAVVKKTAQGTAKVVSKVAISVGKTIEQKVKNYSDKVKRGIGIKKEMTPGQKTGAVIEKVVDGIVKGINILAQKLEDKQAKRFASPQELKIEGYELLIGEGIDKAVSIDRATRCKEFVNKLKDKKVLPYQLKDIRTEIINDAIRGACSNFYSLLNYLKNKGGIETKAEIDFLKKEIKIVKQKIMEEEDGTGNKS